MGKSKFRGQRPLTPAEQAYFLTFAFPQFRVLTVRNLLRAVGTLQPTPTCDQYTIELEYCDCRRPRVSVLRPELRLAPGKTKLPHVFAGNDLCLHLPGDWRPDLRISEYILPWISFWLFFYEAWLITGEWLGGGHEPSAGKNEPI
jgi:hypothetical protein